ncbi:FeoB-associated Cys-rich membrane protein [Caulifigura coniformis]|uniref:FeoB-associated Cys-rich membrane protein n=1 Tax=Caulifigura coniformis TaxID=2527983 RepID=UPI0011A5F333
MSGLDWQTAVTLLCVVLAAAWWIRRAVRWASGDASCGSGCGKCGTPRSAREPELVQLHPGSDENR